MDEIYPWEKLDDSSSESVFLSQQLRFMTSIRDFVGERHSNFYSNTLEFFPLTYGEPLRIEIFSGSKDVILNGLGTRNQPRHHFFRSGCESDCYATFPSKPSLRMAHRSNLLPRDEAKNVGNGRLKWYFCKGLNIHIFIRLMVQKSGDHHLGMKPS